MYELDNIIYGVFDQARRQTAREHRVANAKQRFKARTQMIVEGRRYVECPFCDETHDFQANDMAMYQIMRCCDELAFVTSTPRLEREHKEQIEKIERLKALADKMTDGIRR